MFASIKSIKHDLQQLNPTGDRRDSPSRDSGGRARSRPPRVGQPPAHRRSKRSRVDVDVLDEHVAQLRLRRVQLGISAIEINVLVPRKANMSDNSSSSSSGFGFDGSHFTGGTNDTFNGTFAGAASKRALYIAGYKVPGLIVPIVWFGGLVIGMYLFSKIYRRKKQGE